VRNILGPSAIALVIVLIMAPLPAGNPAAAADGEDARRQAQTALIRAEQILNDALAAERNAKSAADRKKAREARDQAEQDLAAAAVAVSLARPRADDLMRPRSDILVAAPAADPAAGALPESLLRAQWNTDAAERDLAAATAARIEAEIKSAAAIRALARNLADAMDQKKTAGAGGDGRKHPPAEIEAEEARIKSDIRAATAAPVKMQDRETAARARLEAARRHETEIRDAIRTRVSAER